MKLNAAQSSIVTWGILGAVGLALGYVFIKYAAPKLAQGAGSGIGNTLGGLLQGLSHNNLSEGKDTSGNPLPPEGFGGDENYNYSGFGGLSTPAALVNQTLGGLPAAGGEALGGGLFSVFGPTDTTSSTYYTVTFPDGSRHAIGNASVDSNNRFQYGGNTWILGNDGSGNRIATPLTTVYGSGSG